MRESDRPRARGGEWRDLFGDLRRHAPRSRRVETRWRWRPSAAGFAPHGHRCRFERSIGRFPGRQFFRRDAARQRWRRPTVRRRSSHSGPRIAPDCRTGRDRCRPGCACTSRTRPGGARHDADSGGGGSNDGDGIEPEHPVQKHKAMPLQLRNYGS
jgi:hypothetical protein